MKVRLFLLGLLACLQPVNVWAEEKEPNPFFSFSEIIFLQADIALSKETLRLLDARDQNQISKSDFVKQNNEISCKQFVLYYMYKGFLDESGYQLEPKKRQAFDQKYKKLEEELKAKDPTECKSLDSDSIYKIFEGIKLEFNK